MQLLHGIAIPPDWKPAAKPERSRAYLRFIRTKPCLICNTRKQVEAAHSGPHGVGLKASDLDAIPLCRVHHQSGPDSYHALGRDFFSFHRLDREAIIRRLREEFSRRAQPILLPANPV